jgi:hypothetical protein
MSSKFDFKYLSGPISWYNYDFEGKKINLLGDYHSWEENRCPGIDCSDESKNCYTTIRLIKEIYKKCKQENIKGDVYIESRYRHKYYKNFFEDDDDDEEEDEATFYAKQFELHTLTEMINEFYYCLIPEKTKCVYLPNLRFHYVDVRYGFREDLNKIEESADKYSGNYSKLMREKQNVMTLLYHFLKEIEFFIVKAKKFNRGLYLFTKFLLNYFLENEYLFFDILFDENYMIYLNRFYQEIKTAFQMDEMKKILNDREIKEVEKYITFIGDYMKILKYYSKGNQHLVRYELEKLKQEENIFKNYNISERIKKYMFQRLRETVPEFQKYILEMLNLLEIYKDQVQGYDEIFIQQFQSLLDEKIYNIYLIINTLLLDTYCLTRMFRNFEKDGKISVVYLGDYHIKNLVRFLKQELGMNPIHKVIGQPPNQKCLYSDHFDSIMDF